MPDESALSLALWTTDISALSRFLEVAAGMAVDARHPGFASLSAAGAVVELHDDENFRGHPWYDALKREGAARGIGAEIRVRVDDVDRRYQRALQFGARAVEAPCEVDGTRECQLMGPDGFLLTLWQRLDNTIS